MLDVSIRLDILRLLAETKAARGLAMLYITHDIATAAHVAEEIVVMFAGQMVEWGDAAAVTGAPRHPYTQLLLSAVLDPTSSCAAPAAASSRPWRGDPCRQPAGDGRHRHRRPEPLHACGAGAGAAIGDALRAGEEK
jgi:ABC-type dipeptide/oligopeptide/nickel transport system ATPase component